jgi:hypothetical protein
MMLTLNIQCGSRRQHKVPMLHSERTKNIEVSVAEKPAECRARACPVNSNFRLPLHPAFLGATIEIRNEKQQQAGQIMMASRERLVWE